jgi:hypothetical protein
MDQGTRHRRKVFMNIVIVIIVNNKNELSLKPLSEYRFYNNNK